MWPCKKQERIRPPSQARACKDCGCMIALGRGKAVYDSRIWSGEQSFYCDGCAPPYDEVIATIVAGQLAYFKNVPAARIRVTDKGEPFPTRGK